MIMKNTYVSDILNVLNDVKMNWWALEVKFIWDSNKDCQHSEWLNQESVDRENQMISDCQSLHDYLTYSLNFNTGNYRFFINSFNLTFSIMSYLANFPFVYPQNPQAYQYPQTGNKKWQSLALLMLSERKVIRFSLN